MITIVKDGNKMKCSQNTYDTMYKRLGYEILTEKAKTIKEVEIPVKKEDKKQTVEKKVEKKVERPKEGKVIRNKSKKGE